MKDTNPQPNPFLPFGKTIRARFLERPNRFLVLCEIEGRTVEAFLPNPGRLQELLFPDSALSLIAEPPSPLRKTHFTVVAVERDGRPIMLHTHRTNDVARYLIDHTMVPALADAKVERAEVPVGHSRFDFLLSGPDGKVYLEVKSCTLIGRKAAMFPDAVTARGARHLLELAELSRNGIRTAVLFVVHWPDVEVFMPDYHTDLHFAETLLKVHDRVQIIPVSVGWNRDLSLSDTIRVLPVPWDYIEEEAKDRGSYLFMLKLDNDIRVGVGSLGRVAFRKGFYIYVGSAMANLTKRIERHLRLRKLHHWHIDALRDVARVHATLPVRSSVRLECDLAQAVSAFAEWTVPGFGSSDCSCPTHLFGMTKDPLDLPRFHEMLQYFRMDRGF
jgi:sugar fermentation stimulation protein A